MPVHDELGCRMKEFYETIPKTRLMRRTPVAIRIDGKAFHTFTRGFRRPFDPVLARSMWDTMKYLCENIQGCVLGYTQSDEITLILTDYFLTVCTSPMNLHHTSIKLQRKPNFLSGTSDTTTETRRYLTNILCYTTVSNGLCSFI